MRSEAGAHFALTDPETIKLISSSGEQAQKGRPNAMQRHQKENAEVARQAGSGSGGRDNKSHALDIEVNC